MSNQNVKLEARLLEAKTMIENALSDTEIKTALSVYGYDETKLNTGKSLYEEVQELMNKQKKEYGEQYEATKDMEDAWETANTAYIKTLKVARIALEDNTKAGNELMLYGDRKTSISGWLLQAEAFYSNLVADETLLTEMNKYGYTKDKLTSEFALVETVSGKNYEQKKETSEAQEATESRDKKIDELDKWISALRKIAKVALSDTPQKLEKLGILARTEGTMYRKKTKETNTETTTTAEATAG